MKDSIPAVARRQGRSALFRTQVDRVLEQVGGLVAKRSMTRAQARTFRKLLTDAADCVLCHPIVSGNLYLERFAAGVTLAQARHELQQFSVFAHQFDVAQSQLVANAPTVEAYEQRLKVLLNEKGIPYANGFGGELTGKWRMETVHFTWLRNMARALGLGFADVGRRSLGLPGTVRFVQATFDYYASTDPSVAAGAAFGIENWAANGLWKYWIAGMQQLNRKLERPVPLGYLTYHDAEEEHHAQATLDELLESFREPWFDADRFLAGARGILDDGVQPYYESQLETLPEKDDTWPTCAVAITQWTRLACASIPRTDAGPP